MRLNVCQAHCLRRPNYSNNVIHYHVKDGLFLWCLSKHIFHSGSFRNVIQEAREKINSDSAFQVASEFPH